MHVNIFETKSDEELSVLYGQFLEAEKISGFPDDNKMVKLKVGRNIIELDEKDLILDNGACYQIVTKKVGGFDWHYPIMSKKLFNDLKKLELIFTSEVLKQDAIKKYGTSVITYWKFNIERMQKLGY